MSKHVMAGLLSILFVSGNYGFAYAQDTDAGKTAYLSSCAPCHGVDANGEGFLNAVLKVPAPDLTHLAKRNDGTIPIAAVTEIVDGRMLIAAHGKREMPIWGFDVMVRNRISLIVDYLTRIQAK